MWETLWIMCITLCRSYVYFNYVKLMKESKMRKCEGKGAKAQEFCKFCV